MLSNSFYPQIMLPTRSDRNMCTLIENIFMKLSSSYKHMTVGIVFTRISDHLPCFLGFKIKPNVDINSLRPRQDGRHFPDDISNAFSWMKMHKFRLIFHWNLFPRVQLTIFQHWFRLWLGAGQATSHYLNQWWFVHRRIYASLGFNELNELDR